jgi:hypothetical protein
MHAEKMVLVGWKKKIYLYIFEMNGEVEKMRWHCTRVRECILTSARVKTERKQGRRY